MKPCIALAALSLFAGVNLAQTSEPRWRYAEVAAKTTENPEADLGSQINQSLRASSPAH